MPLFLAHANEGLNVHFDHFEKMRKALKKTKVTYLEIKGDDHVFSVQENRESLFIGLHEFLMSTVGQSEYAN